MQGVLVGCDREQEWLLPWWWQHYSIHNGFPVLFIDFGMSQHMRRWCEKKGTVAKAPPLNLTSKEDLPSTIKKQWEKRYGSGFWMRRCAWLKKPSALLLSPFSQGIWLDLDCAVKGSLQPLFDSVIDASIALVRDREQHHEISLPDEIHYNSGVIAFQKQADILHQWTKTTESFEQLLPGDQETLSRAIYLHQPNLRELPAIYNWYHAFGKNPEAVIHHYCGGPAKVEILRSLLLN
jgi:hypothetical protein